MAECSETQCITIEVKIQKCIGQQSTNAFVIKAELPKSEESLDVQILQWRNKPRTELVVANAGKIKVRRIGSRRWRTIIGHTRLKL